MSSMLLSPARQLCRIRNNRISSIIARSQSSYSSFHDPNPTLFKPPAPSSTAQTDDGSAPALPPLLRSDVRTMGSILGSLIQSTTPNVFPQVEELRQYTKQWNSASTPEEKTEVITRINKFLSTLSDKELSAVARSFSHFLALANTAERHNRVRVLRAGSLTTPETNGDDVTHGVGALPPKHDSCGGVLYDLLERGVPADEIYDTLVNQSVEIVLTAHPTEVNRPTIMSKHERIYNHLTSADVFRESDGSVKTTSVPTPYRQSRLNDALRCEISLLWQSSKVSPQKPSPVEEARRGTLVAETTLWDALPSFLRRLDATLYDATSKRLPLTANILKFASWMGGDRDGNPTVTPDVTREVCLENRRTAAKKLKEDLENVYKMLSLVNCGEELRRVVGDDCYEPYRAYLEPIVQRLADTEAWATQSLFNLRSSKLEHSAPTPPPPHVYLTKSQLLDDLLPIHSDLVSTGNSIHADGTLTDVIRRVSTFGLTLLPLDVRQESDRHEEALDCITRYLGLGSYKEWSEKSKIIFLQNEISSHRPLLRHGEWHDYPEIFTPTAVDTLETFEMISEQHPESLGTYVISQATSASDVLAVLLLQLNAGVKKPLPVAPLFETLDDLNGATKTMDTLWSLPAYLGIIGGKQEIMIGYSDSAKDAGRMAASWAQYETQESLANLARERNIDVTFFHGKGGTVGRGGNPATFQAILAHAPDTINSRFRVTEQGEMISQNFGHNVIAERTLDIFTAAVLAEHHIHRPRPCEKWRQLMDRLSEISCDSYRQVVRGDDRFVEYFRTATPELELARLNIGSRPAKKKVGGGVESLRAIPWIFAWMQNRLNMPSWLGVGDAIEEVLKSEDGDELRRMYKEWDSFRTTIHLVEMVLAKSSPEISQNYEETLISDSHLKSLGTVLREKHSVTQNAILDITGHKTLSDDNELLMRLLAVRNPYVYALNVIQAEVLKRLRSEDDAATQEGNNGDKDVLEDALGITITGIANGMGNTG
eukprot:CAMPEP_0172481616 /NCGR_PEP_ID=MMETSP1066-20121228/7616_1 /TAXON_ID=671091 /ORGANISM="Coscinodiscus wailesii, Strain CCMP2513" /LENGTH=994 /DNA_ID=CAMNT_0013244083 /DNA_START=90 /DNA_END=3074 /DNA_ORIENTATION=+